ncbi:MAG: hypothetical protein CMN30_11525 [Sandaracinus sp.]|nr:hypothetical protein [Sandaracinus sp.]|tara:strand:+ start:2279 stop:2785 length:507 start_codon:yes stop_codon:yes gene_type:complete
MSKALFLTLTLTSLGACAGSLPPPATSTEMRHRDDARVVFQASADLWKNEVSTALHYADKLHGSFQRQGVAPDDIHMVLVFHGEAGFHLLNDASFAADPGANGRTTNPNAELIHSLTERGVRVELCSSTMQQHGWTEADLHPDVIVVPGALVRLTDLQMDGYAHLDFD